MDKEDKWLQSFRERSDEFKPELREDSWERLEAALKTPRRRKRITYLWLAAAAIMSGLFLLPAFLLKNTNEEVPVKNSNLVVAEPVAPERQPEWLPETPETTRPIGNSPVVRQIQTAIVCHESAPDLTVPPTPEKPHKEEKPPATASVPFEADFPETEYDRPSRSRHNSWTLALLAGGNNTTSTRTLSSSDLLNSPSEFLINSSGKLGSRGDGEEEEWVYRHRFPLSVGLSIGKRLSNSFSIESGLTYTYLLSDLQETWSAHTGKQELHYLGVPLIATYRLHTHKSLAFYLSAGAKLEYCLSAKQEGPGNPQHTDFAWVYHPDIPPFQLSLNATAGMQWEWLKPVSLFVEPGVSYYFKTGSDIQTIRTERPLMFEIRTGLRLSY